MKTIEFSHLTFTVPVDLYKLVAEDKWVIQGYSKSDSLIWSAAFISGHGLTTGQWEIYKTPEESFQEELSKLRKNQWKTRQGNYFGLILNIPIDHEYVATDKNGSIYSYTDEPIQVEEDKFTCIEGDLEHILNLPVEEPLVNWEHSIKHFPEESNK